MFSKDLEVTIGQCYKQAREQRHEFMTVEHLLLALLENPSAVARAARLRCGYAKKLVEELEIDHPRNRAGAANQRRTRYAADAGLPARAAACRLSRAILRSERSDWCERAGRDLRREGFARGVLPASAGNHPARRGQLHLARHRQDRQRAAQPAARRRAGQGRRGRRRTKRQSAGRIRHQPQRTGACKARSTR